MSLPLPLWQQEHSDTLIVEVVAVIKVFDK